MSNDCSNSRRDRYELKALKSCLTWLCRPRPISVGIAPQVKTAQGLVSYHVMGFRRDDTKSRVSIIVDAEEYDRTVSPHEIAEKIAGPDYCFHASSNITHLVPDEATNRLFLSDEELYAVDPQSRPYDSRRKMRR